MLATVRQIIASILLTCPFLGGCNETRVAEKQKAEQQAAEATAQEERDQVRKKERDLLLSATGGAELARRMSDWLVAEDGMVLVTETVQRGAERRFISISALPTSVPWAVSCGRGGLELSLSGWVEVEVSSGDGSSNDRFSKRLSRGQFDEQECRTLVKQAGKAVIAILAGAGR